MNKTKYAAGKEAPVAAGAISSEEGEHDRQDAGTGKSFVLF